MLLDEKHIIAQLKEKDERAFGFLYDKYSPGLYGVIIRIVKRKALADEVLQEVFLKLWKNVDKYDNSKSKLFIWLYQIARNTSLNALDRKSERTNRLMNYDGEYSIDPSISWNDETLDLKGMLKRIDGKFREVLFLVYLKGFTQKEVSEHLGIPLGTVKTRVRNGLLEMRKLYQFNNSIRSQSIILFFLVLSIYG